MKPLIRNDQYNICIEEDTNTIVKIPVWWGVFAHKEKLRRGLAEYRQLQSTNR